MALALRRAQDRENRGQHATGVALGTYRPMTSLRSWRNLMGREGGCHAYNIAERPSNLLRMQDRRF